MPTWPTSKASTNNVDSGSDSPRLARADIKQNIDNTNSIIDMFAISSPSQDQILVYNNSNARFELSDQNVKTAYFVFGSSELTQTSDVFPIGTKYDPFSIIDAYDDYRFTLSAGTYNVELYTDGRMVANVSVLQLHGDDSSSQITASGVKSGLQFTGVLTPTGSTEYYAKFTASFPPSPPNATLNSGSKGFLKIVKLG